MNNSIRPLTLVLLAGAALTLSRAAWAQNVRKIVDATPEQYQLTLVKAKAGYATIENQNGATVKTLKNAGDQFLFSSPSGTYTWQITFVRGTGGHELDMELLRVKDGTKIPFHVGSHLSEPKVEVTFNSSDLASLGGFKNGDFTEFGPVKFQRLTSSDSDQGGTIKKNQILVLNGQ